jgi:hypothetical protein
MAHLMPLLFDFLHVHRHRDGVGAAAHQDAADGADIAEIAPVGDGDVILPRQQVVGGIEIHPSDAGTINRKPGVPRVGARQTGLAGRRPGAQVAADVAGGQAERSETGDGQMGEILADAAPVPPTFFQRRGHRRRRRIIFEIAENSPVQVLRADQQGRAAAETGQRVRHQLRRGAQQGRVKSKLMQAGGFPRGLLPEQGCDLFQSGERPGTGGVTRLTETRLRR